MAQRIKGQEVTVSMSGPDGVEEGLEVVQSFEAEFMLEILQESYLGETADRFDEIYKGVSGSMEIHMETGKWFDFTLKIQERAQRRNGVDGEFTATATFTFPDDTRRRLVFNNIFFGPMPITAGGRADYVTATLTWNCSLATRIE